MPLNRVVVLLTPVFAALAGWLTEWVAQHFPGTPSLDKGQLTALFIAGATYAFGQAAHWLHGWQKHEAAKKVLNVPGALATSTAIGLAHSGSAFQTSASNVPPPLNVTPIPPVDAPNQS